MSLAPLFVYNGEDEDELNGATFVRVCPHCGRFVKADEFLLIGYQGPKKAPNADCKKCGRVPMPFLGYY